MTDFRTKMLDALLSSVAKKLMGESDEGTKIKNVNGLMDSLKCAGDIVEWTKTKPGVVKIGKSPCGCPTVECIGAEHVWRLSSIEAIDMGRRLVDVPPSSFASRGHTNNTLATAAMLLNCGAVLMARLLLSPNRECGTELDAEEIGAMTALSKLIDRYGDEQGEQGEQRDPTMLAGMKDFVKRYGVIGDGPLPKELVEKLASQMVSSSRKGGDGDWSRGTYFTLFDGELNYTARDRDINPDAFNKIIGVAVGTLTITDGEEKAETCFVAKPSQLARIADEVEAHLVATDRVDAQATKPLWLIRNMSSSEPDPTTGAEWLALAKKMDEQAEGALKGINEIAQAEAEAKAGTIQ